MQAESQESNRRRQAFRFTPNAVQSGSGTHPWDWDGLMDTVHPDLRALLNTCRSAPADDLPRLVLADWLDENNDSDRAEFIRVQCELARPTVDTARTQKLKATERELIAANWHRWVGKLLDVLGEILTEQKHELRMRHYQLNRPRARSDQQPPDRDVLRIDPLARSLYWGFRRGLVHVILTPDFLADGRTHKWLASPDAVWLEEATYSQSRINQLPDWIVPDALRPYLGISLYCPISEPETNPAQDRNALHREIAAALTCKNFEFVRDLTISVSHDVPVLMTALMAADLSSVRRLCIQGKSWTLEAVVTRLAAKRLDNLSSLDINGLELGPSALKALVTSPNFPQLVSLTAYRNNFGDAMMVALADGPLATTLNTVEFMNCGIGDKGMVALVKSGLFERLFGPQLNLSLNPIGDRGMKALARSPGLERFTELIMRECQVADSGATAIAVSPHVRNLKYLDLWNNRIGDAGAIALAGSDNLDGVQDLSLRDNPIGDAGKAALRERFGDRAKVSI